MGYATNAKQSRQSENIHQFFILEEKIMPNVNGKKYSYTPAGMAAAKKAKEAAKKKKAKRK